MEATMRDLRHVARLLFRSPGFTSVAVLCLALGIGANTAVFSVVNAVLLRPFPFDDPDRLVSLFETQPRGETGRTGLSYLNYLDLKSQAGAFEALGAHKEVSLTLTGLDEAERLDARGVSANLFRLLGVRPAHGRLFHEDEDRAGAPGVVLIGDSLWRRRFGGDPGVIDRSILIPPREHVVVGVMPPGFRFPEVAEAWVPLEPLVHEDFRNYRDLGAVGRLAPGSGLDEARAQIETVGERLAREYPDTNLGWSFGLLTLREDFAGEQLPTLVLSLLGAVVFVLLIACANLANIVLSRSTVRRRELAVRAAFGASRSQLLRLLLSESLLLSALGGLLGLLLGYGGIRLLLAAVPAESPLPAWMDIRIDGSVLAFTAAVTVGTAVLFGLAPALQATRIDLQEVLKQGGRGVGAGAAGNRLRDVLVVAEVALAVVLLVGASLFVRSFLALANTGGGFNTSRVLTLRFYLPGEEYDDEGTLVRRVDQVVQRLESLPQVAAVGAANLVPLSGGGSRRSILLDDRETVAGEEPLVFYAGVTSDFFDALGVRLLAGRGLRRTESLERSRVALVNQKFAERFWPDESAVGHRFRVSNDPEEEWMTIVGVVSDFKSDHIDRGIPSSAFVPYPYQTARYMGLIVRTEADPASTVPEIRRAIQQVDPNLPIFQVAPMENVRRLGFWRQRLFGGLFAVFAAVALVLASIGVYGVLSYAVHQRRREVGIRVALGARRGEVLGFFVRRGVTLAVAGIALGLAGAFAASRLIAGLLYGIEATDLASFLAVPLLLALVAVVASYLPARRALGADPVEVLRAD